MRSSRVDGRWPDPADGAGHILMLHEQRMHRITLKMSIAQAKSTSILVPEICVNSRDDQDVSNRECQRSCYWPNLIISYSGFSVVNRLDVSEPNSVPLRQNGKCPERARRDMNAVTSNWIKRRNRTLGSDDVAKSDFNGLVLVLERSTSGLWC